MRTQKRQRFPTAQQQRDGTSIFQVKTTTWNVLLYSNSRPPAAIVYGAHLLVSAGCCKIMNRVDVGIDSVGKEEQRHILRGTPCGRHDERRFNASAVNRVG